MSVKDGASLEDCAELEISLERSGSGEGSDVFTVQLRIDRPGNDVEDRIAVQGLTIDRVELRARAHDAAAYGQLLTDMLFSSGDMRAAFGRARGVGRLRLRLSFGPNAADLQDLRWETMRDPDRPDAALLTDPRILFSRYLSSFDWRPVRLRPRGRLRALVVIANPAGLTAHRLAPVQIADELARARENLVGLERVELYSDPESDPPKRATLERLVEALRDGPDVLYLVCHGGIDRGGQSTLFLDDAQGEVAYVRGVELVQALLDLERRPRFVVLASCEGAGTGHEPSASDGGALMALGPRLAEAGVPAVLAMQGRVLMRTVAEFMPVMFRELMTDGLIDRAVAVARSAISDPKEAWRPALFMRLKRGRVWYDAGFAAGGLGNWDAIRLKIEDAECTPIIGPGLLETLFEYRSWLARRWAQEYFFPLAPAQREDLTAVAQYLASKQGPDFPHKKLIKDLQIGVLQRLSGPAAAPGQPLPALLRQLRQRTFGGREDPYRILADLPLPVFILASPDPLLVQALQERGKRPRVGVLPWRRGLKDPYAAHRDHEPTADEPLVYHLFGTLDAPRSLVVTQDDFVDFLLMLQKPEVRGSIPRVVLERLVDSSLLFFGFQIDSWEFRVVFRTIMQQEGMESSRGPHVAAQIDPEEGRVLDPVGARTYFERYLRGAYVDMYWGTPERFLYELEQHGWSRQP